MSAKEGWMDKNKTKKLRRKILFNETAPAPASKLIQIVVLNPS